MVTRTDGAVPRRFLHTFHAVLLWRYVRTRMRGPVSCSRWGFQYGHQRLPVSYQLHDRQQPRQRVSALSASAKPLTDWLTIIWTVSP